MSYYGRAEVRAVRAQGDTALSRAILAALSDEPDRRQRQMAAMSSNAGVSESTIGQILGGSIMCPPADVLNGIAKALGSSASSLVSAAKSDGCTRYGD